ncbi:hypothetical protein NPIL_127761 [Nephila pilipes]|uniref:Myb/SANT-like DNA-binding domain-containing protein n=1 Tax=Nephila pilipes TaxID=299642 RepID=A0A8X6NRW2_NEPPI|nr:hypothetical protein NPIL_127761 [Nephila pilipes]
MKSHWLIHEIKAGESAPLPLKAQSMISSRSKSIISKNGMGERRHVWTHHETLALIDTWEDKFNLLRCQRRTAHVHEEIRQALAALNIDKSIRQIVVKIDNMTQKYRKTKHTGKKNPTWAYFKRLDSFLGSPPQKIRR